jgi:hypothetical protein
VQEITRLRRTKKLLIFIGSTFLVCWVPLNIFNLVSDTLSFAVRESVFFKRAGLREFPTLGKQLGLYPKGYAETLTAC